MPASLRPGGLVRSVDFESVLRIRSRVGSEHFAVHHLGQRPQPGARRLRAARKAAEAKLSTAGAPISDKPVDEFAHRDSLGSIRLAPRLWFGCVVPKRHARRAVTRSLIKREIRAVVAASAARLPDGMWVVRLRRGFDALHYPSAASTPLRLAVRAELAALFEALLQRPRPG